MTRVSSGVSSFAFEPLSGFRNLAAIREGNQHHRYHDQRAIQWVVESWQGVSAALLSAPAPDLSAIHMNKVRAMVLADAARATGHRRLGHL